MPRGVYSRKRVGPGSHAAAAATLREFADELERAPHAGGDPAELALRGLRVMERIRRFLLAARPWKAPTFDVTANQGRSGPHPDTEHPGAAAAAPAASVEDQP